LEGNHIARAAGRNPFFAAYALIRITKGGKRGGKRGEGTGKG
jgi:hypothetical protein